MNVPQRYIIPTLSLLLLYLCMCVTSSFALYSHTFKQTIFFYICVCVCYCICCTIIQTNYLFLLISMHMCRFLIRSSHTFKSIIFFSWYLYMHVALNKFVHICKLALHYSCVFNNQCGIQCGKRNNLTVYGWCGMVKLQAWVTDQCLQTDVCEKAACHPQKCVSKSCCLGRLKTKKYAVKTLAVTGPLVFKELHSYIRLHIKTPLKTHSVCLGNMEMYWILRHAA
jgi:hypothetical protein